MARLHGSKNRKTLEREAAEKIIAARIEMAGKAPSIDFSERLDSLEIMEAAMRHFYLTARIEQSLRRWADWKRADSALMRAVAVAEKVARYRHAQLSAVKLAGDLNAKMEGASLDEIIEQIKAELVRLGPLLDLDAIRESQRNEERLPVRRTRTKSPQNYAAVLDRSNT